MLDMVQKYIQATNNHLDDSLEEHNNVSVKHPEEIDPPAKRPKLFANYMTKSSSQPAGSALHQLNKYLTMGCQEDEDCVSFWFNNRFVLDKLYMAALRALSVPASSSAVERVFSQGGIILR